jgi:YHS domain-containing protein
MFKKFLLSSVIALVFCIGHYSEGLASPAAKTTATKMAARTGTHMTLANGVAVCGCGKVFIPDATTKYISVDGKEYACCSDPCHEKMSQSPAAAAKMADDNKAKLLAQFSKPAESPKQ